MSTFRAQRLVTGDGRLSATVLGPCGVVDAVEEYLAFLQDLGRSWHTVRAYASDLAIYFDFLHHRGLDWEHVGMPEMAAFSAHLRGTNRANPAPNVVLLPRADSRRSPASVQRSMTAVFGFYDFHTETVMGQVLVRGRQQRVGIRHQIARDPRQMVAVKVAATIKPSLTAEELAVVIGAPARWRDRLLLALLGLNGMRVGAVLGLRHEDIGLRKRVVQIVPREDNVNGARAKRRSPLSLPLHETAARFYSRYLDEEYGNWDSDYVFINLWAGDIGSPMTYDSVRALVARTSRAAGIPFTAHVLRHTFATLLRRGGAEMEAVSQLLGHASVETTRSTYVHTTVEDLRRSLELVETRRSQQP